MARRIIRNSVLCLLCRARHRRHSFASHLVMRGVAIRAVQEMMGHWSIVMTQRYAHLAPEVSRDAVQLLGGACERPASPQLVPEPAAAAQPSAETAAKNSRRTPRT